MALLASRAVGTLLFDLKPYDPATLVGAAGLLIGIGFLASLLPAHPASKLDPMQALRCD
jgi:ABC-type antimicrobial peptide transport system permease subunit